MFFYLVAKAKLTFANFAFVGIFKDCNGRFFITIIYRQFAFVKHIHTDIVVTKAYKIDFAFV